MKTPARTLKTIVGEIRGTLRNDVASIIKRGQLLLEAKEQVEHGKWLPWLEENFDMAERSARGRCWWPSSPPNTTGWRI
jgi:hypothetical protein